MEEKKLVFQIENSYFCKSVKYITCPSALLELLFSFCFLKSGL